MTLGTTLA